MRGGEGRGKCGMGSAALVVRVHKGVVHMDGISCVI